ncbi:mas-related G-protein coupled receptor member H-like [Ambystoma mexicanum]|uniref:mas-related G-protein coupled receptor member H-like n=1 Tax=Ambystoma mexicanum TaxID=8296 RepID=UPI0037E924F9
MQDIGLQPCNDTRATTDNGTVIDLTLLLTMSLPSQLICLLGIAGNGVVLWVLFFVIRRNPFTVYILNLAGADFLLLLCISVFLLYSIILFTGGTMVHSDEVLWFSMRVLFNAGYNSSLFLLTTISVERCLSALCPIWYKCSRPKHLSTVVCVFLWGFSILVTMLECFFCKDDEYAAPEPHCTAVMVFLTALAFGIVGPLMILSSLALVITVQRNSQRRQPLRLYRGILLNVLVFLITAFPIRLAGVFLYFQVIKRNTFNYLTICYGHAFCSTINSSINPYIYFLVGFKKRRTSSELIKGALHRVFRSDQEGSCKDEAPHPRMNTEGCANTTMSY